MHSQQSFKIVSVALIAFISATVAVSPGEHINIEDAPYLVQLTDVFGLTICPGALLTSTHVVTSAQCLAHRKAEDTFVAGGISGFLPTKKVKHAIESWSIPSEFDDSSLNMDVAVIKLRNKLTGKNIQSLPLCSNPLKTGDIIDVIGLGKDVLWSSRYPVMSREQCLKSYSNDETKITNSMFCVADNANDVDLSGLPAVRQGQLCGLFSWGSDNVPGIYTDIAAVKSFIDNAIKS